MKQFEKRMKSAIERESAMTLPQEQRAWTELQQSHPSSSVVEHNLPEGWTVQQMKSLDDVRRVGEMVRNCWQGQPAIDQAQQLGWEWHALHDPHDIPRAVWFTKDGVAQQLTGPRNQPVKPEHREMIQQWADATGRTLDPYDDPYHDQFT
jgi:hypothetical protein